MDAMKKPTASATIIASEIAHLPEDLISASIARTGPRDACRIVAVSPAFRNAANSNIVWNCFLPSNLPSLADEELSSPQLSKKELLMRLSNGPVLLVDGLSCMWLDKETGAMSYMLPARKLSIDWSNTPIYDCWIPINGTRIFSNVAKICRGCRLEIHAKMDSSMLSKHTMYTACIVLAVDVARYCMFGSCQKTAITVSLGGSTSTHDVQLDRYHDLVHQHSLKKLKRSEISMEECGAIFSDAWFLGERIRGWMELELGDFYNGEGEDGDVSISLVDTLVRRSSLIVLGIEIIAKGHQQAREREN